MAEQEKLNFLLADKDLSILDSWAQHLQEIGYPNALLAEDGSEAWALCRNFKIDTIICAVDLPEISGLSLLKLVRSNEQYAGTPFILTAARVTTKLVVQAGKLGVNEIIVVPFTTKTFENKVNNAFKEKNDPQLKETKKNYEEGLKNMEEGRYDEALTSFRNIVQVQENAEVYFNIGYIQAAKGQLEEALANFRKATQLDHHFALAYKQMALIYEKIGKVDDAGKCLEQAAHIYMDRKNDQEAEDILQMLMSIKPNTTNVFNSLGIIYRRQGRLKDSAAMYEKALKVHPKDEHIYYNLSRVYMELKEFTRANDLLNSALAINPDFGAARELIKAVELGLTLSG